MVDQTAKEQLNNYIDKMGAELGPIFHFVRQNFLALTFLWDQFETLFGTPERVKLMNKAGSGLAFSIYWQFLNGVVLGFARLLDPAKSRGFENLTLSRLVDNCHSEMQSELLSKLAVIQEQAAFVRDLRNKIIAHSDLDHALGNLDPLEYASRRDVTALCKLVLEFLNHIDSRYTGSSTYIMPMGNRDALNHLGYLARGELFHKAELEAFRSRSRNSLSEYELPKFLGESEEERRRYG